MSSATYRSCNWNEMNFIACTKIGISRVHKFYCIDGFRDARLHFLGPKSCFLCIWLTSCSQLSLFSLLKCWNLAVNAWYRDALTRVHACSKAYAYRSKAYRLTPKMICPYHCSCVDSPCMQLLRLYNLKLKNWLIHAAAQRSAWQHVMISKTHR